MQVELLRQKVAPRLKKPPPRPRRHVLVQLPAKERLEPRLKEDLEWLLKPRVELHRPEHVRHVQGLPVAPLHRRQKRVRVAKLAELRQESPPHVEEQLKRLLRQKKRWVLWLELKLLP